MGKTVIKCNETGSPNTIWQLLKSIHSKPGMREWMTIESVALKPLPDIKSGLLHVLIASPVDREKDSMMQFPWAYLCWKWPSLKWVAFINISELTISNRAPISKMNICTKNEADQIQICMETQSEYEYVPQELADIYRMVLSCINFEDLNIQLVCESLNSALNNRELEDECKSVKSPGMAEARATKPPVLLEQSVINLQAQKLHRLICDSDHREMLKEWSRIYSSYNSPHFSVAIVGEFARGKTSLVNSIIGSHIFPCGASHRLSSVGRVLHGTKPSYILSYKNNLEERLDNYADLCSALEDTSKTELSLLQAITPNEWLRRNNIQLIDTPGFNLRDDYSTSATMGSIACCDATIVTISASSPLSMSERDLIEKHILARKVPCISVILTQTETIRNNELPKLVDYLQNELKKYRADIPLWCADESAISICDEGLLCGAQMIREGIESWVQSNDKDQLKNIFYVQQMVGLVSNLINSLTNEKSLIEMELYKQTQMIEQARAQLDIEKTRWLDVRSAISEKELVCTQCIEEMFDKASQNITLDLVDSLMLTNNLHEWWEKACSRMFEKQLRLVKNKIGAKIHELVDNDIKWLNMQIKDIVSNEPAIKFDGMSIPMQTVSALDRKEIVDLSIQRNNSDIAIALAAVGAVLVVAGPVGVLVATGGRLISNHFYKKSVEKQKEELANHLTTAIHQEILKICNNTIRQVTDMYKKMTDTCFELEDSWYNSQMRIIKKGRETKDTGELEAFLKKCNIFLAELYAILGDDCYGK